MLLCCHHGQLLVKLDLSDHSCSSQPSFQRGTLTPYTLWSSSSACRVCPWISASHTNLCSAPAKPAPLQQPELPRWQPKCPPSSSEVTPLCTHSMAWLAVLTLTPRLVRVPHNAELLLGCHLSRVKPPHNTIHCLEELPATKYPHKAGIPD